MKKCAFGLLQLEYFGHVISKDGLKAALQNSKYYRRVLGCYPLLSYIEEVLGMIWFCPKQVLIGKVGA